MQPEGQETVTIVKVSFSEEEWALLKGSRDLSAGSPANYIHDVVMRSLRRRKRKTKKGVQP